MKLELPSKENDFLFVFTTLQWKSKNYLPNKKEVQTMLACENSTLRFKPATSTFSGIYL